MLDQLPERFDGPSAWIGADLAQRPDQWIYDLCEAEIAELIAAAANYLALGQDIGEIEAQSFPLPQFGPRLAEVKEALLHGIGFRVLRGLPVADLDQATCATIFCGIGTHLGSARSQNADGHILGHVRDVGADPKDPNSRIYQTSARQTFHTDSADAVGLLCLREAREGGDSLLVSVESIFNRMRVEDPALLPLLFDPISTDRRGEVPEGMDRFMSIPPLSWYDGKLTVFYQRQYIDSAQRFDGAFPLSPDHVAALDAFDAYANDPTLHLRMRLRPGDMQFVHNHGQLHDRTGFIDWPDPKERRHLLRLWLSLTGDRALPPVFAERYGQLTIGARGGIITAKTKLHAPIDV